MPLGKLSKTQIAKGFEVVIRKNINFILILTTYAQNQRLWKK